ncbi:sensor histidine kinase [Jiangella muralis]|uniref:sensor histidine kinase n=1 Tax=Jiangella muralis TaxID=702383 RepID=UPI00069D5E9F|nr:HAMP domain-containing sensor histidine kinase [Jiangella muralis]
MRKARAVALRGSTVRLRYTALYGALFLLSGAALLAIAYLLSLDDVSRTEPLDDPASQRSALAQAQLRIGDLEAQLAQVQADQSHQLLTGSAIALAVMTVVSIVLGHLVAGRVLRPLRTITAATQRITADNLHERLALAGPADEVTDLADTIDGLLDRLESSFTAQRRFVANASHELRTPLATMRASLDVAVAKPEPAPAQTVALADRVRTELDLVDRLLEALLTLAHAQVGGSADSVPVSLGRVTAAALRTRAADIADKHLTVDDRDLQDGAWTQGNQTLLSRMVDNVIDNAIVHNQAGGWIRVETTTHDASVVLAVETGGEVLAQEQVAALSQPFRRLGGERTGSDTGSGLGLSIVAAIASTHQGRLDLRARPRGGLAVTITLPSAETPAGARA